MYPRAIRVASNGGTESDLVRKQTKQSCCVVTNEAILFKPLVSDVASVTLLPTTVSRAVR